MVSAVLRSCCVGGVIQCWEWMLSEAGSEPYPDYSEMNSPIMIVANNSALMVSHL